MEFGPLKVLMISRDRNIFKEGCPTRERMKAYGKLVGELHIVVFSTRDHGFKKSQVAENVWAYPTCSRSRWSYIGTAASLGKKIVLDRKFVRGRSLITTQDPFECGLAGLKIKRKWRLPLEVQLHTDPFSPYFRGFLNNVRKRIARKVLKHADNIRVVSENQRSRISNLVPGAQISVLPILVDKEQVSSSPVSFDVHARFGWHFVMLTVSRLSEEKSIDFALEVLAEVRQKFPDTGLLIVGSGPEEGRLKKLTKKLGLERNVSFEGWQEQLGSYYKTSNVFVQTSLFEGYGLSLVEAGLSGLPVVTTPVGIAQELDNGKDLYICPPGDLAYFTNAVIDLLENNLKRENLRINMRRTLESKLISKEEYLHRISSLWDDTARKVNARI